MVLVLVVQLNSSGIVRLYICTPHSVRFFLGPFLHLRQKSVSGSGIAVKSSSMNSATSLRMQTTTLIRPALRIRNVRQAIVAVAEYLHNLAIEFYAQKQSV